jgi:hypothetical protein
MFILDVFFRIKQWHNLAILALIFLMNPGFLDNPHRDRNSGVFGCITQGREPKNKLLYL